jgi:N utilization substance protein B
MPARHRSRQRALQVLFQMDLYPQEVDSAIERYYDTLWNEEGNPPTGRDDFMEELVRGAVASTPEIDGRISKNSEHWRIERMPVVDRNILRLAIFEMSHRDTPAAVVIDEALELARQFSGDESVAFINGVLDAVRRDTP